jgi:hypothetical protein
LYDAASANGRNVGIVSCNAYLEVAQGLLPGTYADRHGDPNGATLTDILRSNAVFVSALCPATAVRGAGGFSNECWGSEDHDLWLRILEMGYEVLGTPEPLVIYRVSEYSVSSDATGMARTTQATYRRALARGRLDRRQKRIARAALRTARAAEAFERLSASRVGWRARVDEILRAMPTFAIAALSQPSRWPHWIRLVAARARRS